MFQALPTIISQPCQPCVSHTYHACLIVPCTLVEYINTHHLSCSSPLFPTLNLVGLIDSFVFSSHFLNVFPSSIDSLPHPFLFLSGQWLYGSKPIILPYPTRTSPALVGDTQSKDFSAATSSSSFSPSRPVLFQLHGDRRWNIPLVQRQERDFVISHIRKSHLK